MTVIEGLIDQSDSMNEFLWLATKSLGVSWVLAILSLFGVVALFRCGLIKWSWVAASYRFFIWCIYRVLLCPFGRHGWHGLVGYVTDRTSEMTYQCNYCNAFAKEINGKWQNE